MKTIRQMLASILQPEPDFIPLNVSRNGGPDRTILKIVAKI